MNLSPLEQKRQELESVINAPKKKHSLLQNIGWMALNFGDKYFNPNDNTPVRSLDDTIHQRNINKAQGELQPLQTLEQQRQAERDAQLNTEYKKAQIGNIEEDNVRQRDQIISRERMSQENVRAKVESESLKFERRKELLNRSADIKSGEAKIYTDEDGKLFKQFLKADSTGKFRDPEPIDADGDGIQDTDPNKLFYDVYDPVSGQTVKAKGGTIYGAGATIRQGDANREQQVNAQNAQFDMQAQRENANNLMTFNKQVFDKAMDVNKQMGRTNEDLAEMQGYYAEMQGVFNELQKVDANQDPDRYNKLADKLNELNGKVQSAAGKTQAGAEAVKQLSGQGIKTPPMVKAPKVNAVRVGTAKRPKEEAEKYFREKYKPSPEKLAEMMRQAGY
jgi:uncharacterized protein YdcH (DUF465 family)